VPREWRSCWSTPSSTGEGETYVHCACVLHLQLRERESLNVLLSIGSCHKYSERTYIGFLCTPTQRKPFQQSISCTSFAARIAQQQGNKYGRNPVYTYTRTTKRSKGERAKWRVPFFWISSSITSLGVNLFSFPLYIFTTLHY
jgi:hypothetical protein